MGILNRVWISQIQIRNFKLELLFPLQSHTILLVQPTKRPEGRTYADYESVNECMEGEFNTNQRVEILGFWCFP
jgi:hypothetical protein